LVDEDQCVTSAPKRCACAFSEYVYIDPVVITVCVCVCVCVVLVYVSFPGPTRCILCLCLCAVCVSFVGSVHAARGKKFSRRCCGWTGLAATQRVRRLELCLLPALCLPLALPGVIYSSALCRAEPSAAII